MKKVAMAFALAALLTSGAAMAQSDSADAGEGTDSQVSQCRNRLERAELRAQSATDGSKEPQVLEAVQRARAALASGNATKCLSELTNVGS